MSDESAFDFTRALRGDQLDRLRSGSPSPEDIAAFRRMFALDQAGFAAALGVDAARLTAWESGQAEPDRSQRSLISILARHPRILLRHELPIAG